MTTFHEPPAQSRRAARQSERGETAGVSGDQATYNAEQPANQTPSAPHEDTVPPAQSPAAGYPTSPPSAEPAAASNPPQPSSGRRARARNDSQSLYDVPTIPPASNGEPLTYLTQGAPFAPAVDSAAAVHPAPAADSAPQSLAERLSNGTASQTPSQPTAEAPAYRLRDYSPEGGRRAARAAEAAVPDAPLNYQTQQAPPAAESTPETAAPETTAPPAPTPSHASYPDQQQHFTSTVLPVQGAPAPAPAPQPQTAPVQREQGASVTSSLPVEQTLTRRELRALQAEQEAAAGVQNSSEVPPLVEPEAHSSTASALSNAIAEFESLSRSAQSKAAVTPPPPAEPQPVAPVQPPTAAPFAGLAPPAPGSAMQPDSDASTPWPPSQAASVQLPVSTHQTVPVQPPPPTPDGLVPRFVEPVLDVVVDLDVVVEPSYASSAGHWSRQAALDDETQPFENTLSREVGRGNVSTATNALVLPMTAQINDIAAAINSTGEILVTGSITLPATLGSKGGDSRRYDDPDVDALFDAYDNELVATDSAPISAIRAVSTHTSTHGVITANKPTGNRMLTGMMILAGVMGVAVFGLLIAGFVFNIF